MLSTISKWSKSTAESINKDHNDDVKPAPKPINKGANDHIKSELKNGEGIRLHIIISVLFFIFIGTVEGAWVAALATIVVTYSVAAMVHVIDYYKVRYTSSKGTVRAAQRSKELGHGQLQQSKEPGRSEIKVEDVDDDFTCLM